MMKVLLTIFKFFLTIIIFSLDIVIAQVNDSVNLVAVLEKLDQNEKWEIMKDPLIIDTVGNETLILEELDYIYDYDFKNGIYANFIEEEDSIFLNLSIYFLPSQISAFGFYSREKSPSKRFFNIGFESFLTHNRLIVWYGEFVIYAHILDSLENLYEPLRDIVGETIENLPKRKRRTPILDALPEKNRVEHSAKFYPRRWLGQDYFSNVRYADYHTAEGYSRIFIIDNETTARADGNFWNYFSFIEQNAQIISDTLDIDTDYFVINEPLWGKTILTKKNHIIYGILDYRNKKWAQDRLSEILNALKKKKIVKPG